ncbi:hypothetical protein LJ737_07805 [Hymenobacter sp. 15J16-1T3B]|uniref:hypothetical protein n=1 Tax=Hymenobacter sp. 15J16-1T3B TaxID=2886941 RepID=UPI001D116B16|nr:hypothetical protein [Hymenobacter sp. 15J16-1T3B]MCC3157139.1 hypothetical protein [Hymenobacter sp. 15J16-1T3B]
MLRRLLCIPVLLLGACAPRPTSTPRAAPPVSLQIQPSADTVFNIVWLRTSLRNPGPRRVWVVQQPDSVNLVCAEGGAFVLLALSPERDSMQFCGPCQAAAPATRKLVPLEPGAERVTYLRVDFNYLFPRRALASVQPCGRYFNRTVGAYQLRVAPVQVAPSPRGGLLAVPASNTVTIQRKQ